MNTDIRLSVEFFDHPKTLSLKKKLGADGVVSLMTIWVWAARNRPNGSLTNVERNQTELIGRWNGEENVLIDTLIDLGFIDDEDGVLTLHDWENHNPWAAKADERGDVARFSRMAKTHPDIYKVLKEKGFSKISKEEYKKCTKSFNEPLTNVERNVKGALTPSPSPSPKEYNPPTPQKTGGESEEKRFTPPSVEEVSEYCESRQNGIDPQEFVAFYVSNGWRVGKNKMRNWKAAVWTWEKRRARENPKPVQEKPEDYSRYLDAIRAQQ